jgi:hypothetical protein
LAVEVEAGFGFADEGVVGLEAVEIFAGFGVDGIGIRIGAWGEVDFGAKDVEEGVGFAVGEGAGFLGIDDVVGDGGDIGDLVGGRGEGVEGLGAHGLVMKLAAKGI